MAIVVTGSKGLIGTRFFELYSGDDKLISVDLPDGFDILDPDGFRSRLHVELTRADSDKRVTMVHLAAFTDVSGAYHQNGDKSSLCYRLNVEGTENVVQLANELDAHLIHISTDFVFDGEKDTSYSEIDEPKPVEWYGETKWIAEQCVQKQSNSWTIMRIAFPFHRNPGVRPDLIKKIREKLSSREQLFLFGDQTITPTFADDVVNAIVAFVETQPEGELFHVMGPVSLSPYELGLALAEIDDQDAAQITETSLVDYLKQDPRPRQRNLSMDTSKYQGFCESQGTIKPRSVAAALR